MKLHSAAITSHVFSKWCAFGVLYQLLLQQLQPSLQPLRHVRKQAWQWHWPNGPSNSQPQAGQQLEHHRNVTSFLRISQPREQTVILSGQINTTSPNRIPYYTNTVGHMLYLISNLQRFRIYHVRRRHAFYKKSTHLYVYGKNHISFYHQCNNCHVYIQQHCLKFDKNGKSGHFEGGTRGNAVPIITKLLECMVIAFPLLKYRRTHKNGAVKRQRDSSINQ